MTGSCSSIPSRKKPNTHEPGINPVELCPIPEMDGDVTGRTHVDHGRSCVGISAIDGLW
jgi:hypothetical protein